MFSQVFTIFSNKKKGNLYAISYDCCINLINNSHPWIIPDLVNLLISLMKKSTRDSSKINGLKILLYLSENYKEQIKFSLIKLIFPICELLYNPKKSVNQLATDVLIV